MDPTLEQGAAVAHLLWPDFVEEGGAVFLRSGRLAAAVRLSSFRNLVEAECFVNHVHILDEFEHDAGLDEEPFWNSGHDDFKRAVALAAIIAEVWAARLARDFPDQSFAVFATRDDNPIVRFHKIRPDLALYQDSCDIERLGDGSALMLRLENGRVTQRVGYLACR